MRDESTRIQFRDSSRAALQRIGSFVAWLDARRSQSLQGKDWITYDEGLAQELRPQEKLLTHWLCYITDRQMRYEAVWRQGGQVFSQLVLAYRSHDERELLDPRQPATAFLRSDGKKPFFRAPDRAHVVEEVERRRPGAQDEFASRFPEEHAVSIRRTLGMLRLGYERNLAGYIGSLLRRYGDRSDMVSIVACALHLLAYAVGKRDGASQTDCQAAVSLVESEELLAGALKRFEQSRRADKKRLWCSLRDYLKPGSQYRGYLLEALRALPEGPKLAGLWERAGEQCLGQLELPGDVWNERESFRTALFGRHVSDPDQAKRTASASLVRALYEYLSPDAPFYPEQFDVTFDFVPRMCERSLCEVCPLGELDPQRLCHENAYEKLCSVALLCGGYIVSCTSPCVIRDKPARGACSMLVRGEGQV